MPILINAVLILILPVQFFYLGLFSNSADEKKQSLQLEQLKNEGKKSARSFKDVLSDPPKGDDNFGGSGLIPQRKKGYPDTKIFAGSSAVIDVDSGTILHYDKGREKIPIASLTKIMTAVLVMEKVKNLDEVVAIDEEALLADGTRVGCPRSGYCVDERLHLGEKITAGDLLMAMLMNSANDAAIALGNHIGGSQKGFADLMNEKAKELNLVDSHFCNPSGLDEDGCYSSAYDIARIAAYSMRYDRIWKIMKQKEIDVNSVDGKYTHRLKNTDVIMDEVPNCLGGKTGFTYNAGKSLLMAAADPKAGKRKVIAVILNDNNRWVDMKALLKWVFESYEWK